MTDFTVFFMLKNQCSLNLAPIYWNPFDLDEVSFTQLKNLLGGGGTHQGETFLQFWFSNIPVVYLWLDLQRTKAM